MHLDLTFKGIQIRPYQFKSEKKCQEIKNFFFLKKKKLFLKNVFLEGVLVV